MVEDFQVQQAEKHDAFSILSQRQVFVQEGLPFSLPLAQASSAREKNRTSSSATSGFMTLLTYDLNRLKCLLTVQRGL